MLNDENKKMCGKLLAYFGIIAQVRIGGCCGYVPTVDAIFRHEHGRGKCKGFWEISEGNGKNHKQPYG